MERTYEVLATIQIDGNDVEPGVMLAMTEEQAAPLLEAERVKLADDQSATPGDTAPEGAETPAEGAPATEGEGSEEAAS